MKCRLHFAFDVPLTIIEIYQFPIQALTFISGASGSAIAHHIRRKPLSKPGNKRVEHECGNNRISSRKLSKTLDIIKMFFLCLEFKEQFIGMFSFLYIRWFLHCVFFLQTCIL